MEVYFSCCLILPSNPAPQYVVQPSPKIHTQQQQQKQAYLLHHPASQSPVSCYIEILADMGMSHQNIFLVSTKGTWRVPADKVKCNWTRSAKVSCFFRCHEVRRDIFIISISMSQLVYQNACYNLSPGFKEE